jgi:hypothetical protein
MLFGGLVQRRNLLGLFFAVLTALPIAVTSSRLAALRIPLEVSDDLNQIRLKVRQGDDDSAQVFRLIENIFDNKDASA